MTQIALTSPAAVTILLERSKIFTATPGISSYVTVAIPAESVAATVSAETDFGPYLADREVTLNLFLGTVVYEVKDSAGGGPVSAASISSALDAATPAELAAIQASVSGAYAHMWEIGRRPLRASVLGNSFCAIYGANWFYEICAASNGMLVIDSVLGIGGNTTAMMLARVATVPSTADVCFVFEGSNDANGGVTALQHATNIRDICNALLARGILPILCAEPPMASNGSFIGSYRCATWGIARSLKLPLIDPFGAYFALTNGWLAGSDADGTHPTELTYRDAGRTAWDQLRGFAVPQVLRRMADTFGSSVAGGLFQTNTAGVGTGWTKSGSGVATIADGAADGVRGNWQVLTATSMTGVTQIFSTRAFTAANVVGNKWAFRAAVKSTLGTANCRVSLMVRWLNSGGGGIVDDAFVNTSARAMSPRFWQAILTQPAGAVSARVIIELRASDAAAFSGEIAIGEVLFDDITALSGATDI